MQTEHRSRDRLAHLDVHVEKLRPESESLIVHVLFIDLVSYSKLSMDEQRLASTELATVVQGVEAYGRGIEMGTLTCLDTGDGMALAFEGDPVEPALTALEIAVARGQCPTYPIRMGLHSGPAMRVVDINGKRNYKGVGINVAQRVMDRAQPGQITLTEHYASTLRSYKGWPERIVNRGVHTVKHGLKLRICELLHPFSQRDSVSTALARTYGPKLKLRWRAAISWVVVLLLLYIVFGSSHPLRTLPFASQVYDFYLFKAAEYQLARDAADAKAEQEEATRLGSKVK